MVAAVAAVDGYKMGSKERILEELQATLYDSAHTATQVHCFLQT